MSNDSNIFYNGAFDTLLSNYTLSVSGGGQIIVTNPDNNNQLIGIPAPVFSSIEAQDYMLIYSKKYNEYGILLSNYEWVRTNSSQIGFTKEWQLLTSDTQGKFKYIDAPNLNEGYLTYNSEEGITWKNTTTTLPFIPGQFSQIIAYETYTGNAVSLAAFMNNYVLYSTTTTNTGLAWGYVTPLMLGINPSQIQNNLVIRVNQDNTFDTVEIPIFNYDLIKNGAIVYFYRGPNDETYFKGTNVPSLSNQVLFSTISQGNYTYSWSYVTTSHLGIDATRFKENQTYLLCTNSNKNIFPFSIDSVVNAPYYYNSANFETPYLFDSETSILQLSTKTSDSVILETNQIKSKDTIQIVYKLSLCILDNFTAIQFGYNDTKIDIKLKLNNIEIPIDTWYLSASSYTFNYTGSYVLFVPESVTGDVTIDLVLTPNYYNMYFIGLQNVFVRMQFRPDVVNSEMY